MHARRPDAGMSGEEIESILLSRGHGTLSLPGDPPYSLPVSYGYDAERDRCVFQLMIAPGSEKRTHVDGAERATFVAYDWADPDDWWSVVATGHLERIDSEPAAASDVAGIFARTAATVSLSVFGRPVTDLVPEWYALTIETIDGRRSPASRPAPTLHGRREPSEATRTE